VTLSAWARALCLAATLPLLSSCGGNQESDDTQITDPAFVGRWRGPWQSSGSSGTQTGTVDLTIAETGKMAGTVHNASSSVDGEMSGTVDGAGSMNATYTHAGNPPVTVAGTLTLQQNGHLVGAVQSTSEGQLLGTSTVDLVKQ
jgi:hypothetical protein